MDSIIKFIYENCEPEKSNFLFGVSNDTLFTVVTSTTTFALGFAIKNIFEKRKEKKRLLELKEYFLTLSNILESPVKRQMLALIGLYKNLKKPEDLSLKVELVASFRVDLIRAIDSQDLYRLFIEKKNNVSSNTIYFQKLLEKIQYIEDVRIAISNFDTFYKLIEKHSSNFKDNLKLIMSMVDEIVINTTSKQKKIEDDEFLVEIIKLKANWFKQENYKNSNVANEYFVEKLLELSQKKQFDERSFFFSKHSLECVMAYKNILHVKYQWRADLITYSRGLQTSLFYIKDSISHLTV